ncbi:metal-dependent hydrolase [Vibrio sp. D431a]|uniref:metal-dependent hydrolase n=1 Tax=Vibrio sp. D431a TaxID=2837388 RepID=UPI0025537102|nr:metal-dependent hydrolase [Vibrio sp. D431a]MDK9790598.1 metal-dependent hydrolase [Vibrio sp. D431a]
MTGKGHTQCGFAFSVFPIMVSYQNVGAIPAALAMITCVLGATAPDWLEIRVTKNGESRTLIPHRTITHIIALWTLLAIYAYCSVKGIDTPYYDLPLIEHGSVAASLFGFACGGLVHLLGDIPNKQKIPIFTTYDGIAFNLWKSGKNEGLLVALTSFIAMALMLWELEILW